MGDQGEPLRGDMTAEEVPEPRLIERCVRDRKKLGLVAANLRADSRQGVKGLGRDRVVGSDHSRAITGIVGGDHEANSFCSALASAIAEDSLSPIGMAYSPPLQRRPTEHRADLDALECMP